MENTDSFSASILWKPWIVLQLVFYGDHGNLFNLYSVETTDSYSACVLWKPRIVFLLVFYGNHG